MPQNTMDPGAPAELLPKHILQESQQTNNVNVERFLVP